MDQKDIPIRAVAASKSQEHIKFLLSAPYDVHRNRHADRFTLVALGISVIFSINCQDGVSNWTQMHGADGKVSVLDS